MVNASPCSLAHLLQRDLAPPESSSQLDSLPTHLAGALQRRGSFFGRQRRKRRHETSSIKRSVALEAAVVAVLQEGAIAAALAASGTGYRIVEPSLVERQKV